MNANQRKWFRRRGHEAGYSMKAISPPIYEAFCLCGWGTPWPGIRDYGRVKEALRQHRLIVRGGSEP